MLGKVLRLVELTLHLLHRLKVLELLPLLELIFVTWLQLRPDWLMLVGIPTGIPDLLLVLGPVLSLVF